MQGAEAKKMALVQECLYLDNPRSPKEYIANLMAWSAADLAAYLERRRREQAGRGPRAFRPHP